MIRTTTIDLETRGHSDVRDVTEMLQRAVRESGTSPLIERGLAVCR
jgi:thiamine phosphate synthase YjbQ (UPF0047 family)